jgi:hypothetical protein
MGDWRYSSAILHLGTRREISQFHTPAALPPGKGPRYSLDRRLGRPQSRFGRCGEITPIGNQTRAVLPEVRFHIEWAIYR